MSESYEIDALYKAPLAGFTAARNALAKSRGAAGAAIKALEKPSLPAWAVNQIYWSDRPTWDALVAASLVVRRAHVDVISGRPADVAAAEAAHTAALRSAVQSAKRAVEAAGDKATPATIEAITETLQALPSDEPPGRLTRALKPLGFAALLAMGIPVGQGSRVQGSRVQGPGSRGSEVPGSRSAEVPTSRSAEVRARKEAEKALRAAEAAEAKAEAALAEAKKAAAAAQRELDRVRDRIVFLEKQRADAEETVRQKARALQDAANARVQAAQDLRALPD